MSKLLGFFFFEGCFGFALICIRTDVFEFIRYCHSGLFLRSEWGGGEREGEG